jgi:hypothetical protein
LKSEWFDNSTCPGVYFFALPLEIVKNRDHVYEGRPVLLNDIAKEVIRNQIGNDSKWIFPHPETVKPIKQMNCTVYQTARERATRKIHSIKITNIHALKHTYGARLKALGISRVEPLVYLKMNTHRKWELSSKLWKKLYKSIHSYPKAGRTSLR